MPGTWHRLLGLWALVLVVPLGAQPEFPLDVPALQQSALAQETRSQGSVSRSLAFAEACRAAGLIPKAEATLRALHAAHPGQPAVGVALGRLQIQTGQYGEAIATLDEVVRSAPRDPSVQFFALDMALLRMDFPSARRQVDAMLAARPRDSEVQVRLAKLDYDLGRLPEAERTLAMCLADPAGPASAWTLASIIHRTKQENEEWARCGRKAVARDPLNVAARVNLADILQRGEHKAGESDVQVQIALRLDPFSIGAHDRLGNGWALESYPPTEAAGPFSAALVVADQALCHRDWEGAERALATALALRPGDARALVYRGAIPFYKGDFDQAIPWFRAALAKDPKQGLAHYALALTLKRKLDQVNLSLASARRRAAAADAAEPRALREVFVNYPDLDPGLQRLVRIAVQPLAPFLPRVARAQGTFDIFPFHHFLWESHPELKGTRTFDGRLWDDVKGVGGLHAAAGAEWERGAGNLRYDVLAHEFAHQVHAAMPADLRAEITRLYAKAKAERRTLDFYSDENEMEYFAVGVEAYVSQEKLADEKGTYGHVRQELERRDPELYRFIQSLALWKEGPRTDPA
jgi:tetratricopeptide (TPR) repeat protein